MDIDDEDSLDSILTEIESSLRTSYPDTGANSNEVFSAYHDDLRTVGYGRRDGDSLVTYNNPFDPRLTFKGLGEHIYHPDIKDEKHKAELTQNVFLALDQPSQFMDKYLNGYRAYVRGLSGSPGSGDWMNCNAECKRLYDRISSDSVKSIWSDNSENVLGERSSGTDTYENKFTNPHPKAVATAHNLQPKPTKTTLTRHTLRTKETRERKHETEAAQPEWSSADDCEVTDDIQNDTHFTTSLQSTRIPISKEYYTTAESQNRKEAIDSWAGLFKTAKDDQNSNQSSETISEEEECLSNANPGSSNSEHVTSVTSRHEQTNINTVQPCKTSYMNQKYTQGVKSVSSNPARSQEHHEMKYQVPVSESGQQQQWLQHAYRQESYNNQPRQLWTDNYVNQQQCQLTEYNTHHQTNYQPHQTYIQQPPPPPPPGFNRILPQNRPLYVTSQRSNYQTEQQSGLYHTTQQQDMCEQQSPMYNLQRYVQQPAVHVQNTTNRYQYYQGVQKPQFMYQGNWNANNNSEYVDDDFYSNDIKTVVNYSKQSLDTSEDLQNVKEHRDKPRYKTRQIRTNLIRIYPSKDCK